MEEKYQGSKRCALERKLKAKEISEFFSSSSWIKMKRVQKSFNFQKSNLKHLNSQSTSYILLQTLFLSLNINYFLSFVKDLFQWM